MLQVRALPLEPFPKSLEDNDFSRHVTPEYGRHFLGPNPAVVPKPTDEANRCNLRHVTPKTPQKALYVEFLVNEVSVSQQLARRDRHFWHAGNNPECANAAQAPSPSWSFQAHQGDPIMEGRLIRANRRPAENMTFSRTPLSTLLESVKSEDTGLARVSGA